MSVAEPAIANDSPTILEEAPISIINESEGSIELQIDLREPQAHGDWRTSLFQKGSSIRFRDVAVVPSPTELDVAAVDLSSRFARSISLRVPVAVGRANARAAISAAIEGGIGVVSSYVDIRAQVREVQRVKDYVSGWVSAPVSIGVNATVREAFASMRSHDISGLPVVDSLGHLVGICTKRDLRFVRAHELDRGVREFMTRYPIITIPEGSSTEEALQVLASESIEKLPVVDAHNRLVAFTTFRDLTRAVLSSQASVDTSGRLVCAAAVGLSGDVQLRVAALVRAGVNAIVLEQGLYSNDRVLEVIDHVKSTWPGLAVVAPARTDTEAKALADAEVDAISLSSDDLTRIHRIGLECDSLPVVVALDVVAPGDEAKAMIAGASSVIRPDSGWQATIESLRYGMASIGVASLTELQHSTELHSVKLRSADDLGRD